MLPTKIFSFLDYSGLPLSMGLVYTARAGTVAGKGQSYPKAMYQDNQGAHPEGNPIILGTDGTATTYTDGYYSIAVYSSRGELVATQDNIG